MKYNQLSNVFYNDRNNFEKEYHNRFNSYSALKTNLFIHPFDRGERITEQQYELFYMHSLNDENLKDKIYDNSKLIKKYQKSLPGPVNQQLLHSQIIEEIKSTNDIEGVQSTKKEIGEALQNKDSQASIRFQGIVMMYVKLGEKNYHKIEEVTKFRKIYDELFINDMPKEDLPDGELFRKKVVYIGDDNKHVHQGNPDEETIIRDMNKLVGFMNEDSIPFLLKCVITHYYFEYIHPFYDGNGRMGRYLMSNYLTRKLDSLTGISISNAVINSKKQYEKAFASVSDPRNRGDLTLFVQTMYESIISGQKQIIEELETAKAKLANLTMVIDQLELPEEEEEILFLMAQKFLFDVFDEPFTDKEIREFHNLSSYKSKKVFTNLEQKGYVKKVGKNPIKHILSDKLTEKI